MLKYSLLFILVSLSNILHSEENITAYFSNDSVNGLKISDAYETHNMGLIYRYNDMVYTLDLGIVSPDMHVYKNEYRVANRSFGELITLSVGQSKKLQDKVNMSYFAQFKSSGSYGVDKMQDFMHKILSLQPVNYVNNLVRMPNNKWVGIGGSVQSNLGTSLAPFNQIGVSSYIGTDRFEIGSFVKGERQYRRFNASGEAGLNYILYDYVVSAPPISAEIRNFIPYVEFGLLFNYFNVDWFIRDRFSLASIDEDTDVFGVLSAGVTIPIN